MKVRLYNNYNEYEKEFEQNIVDEFDIIVVKKNKYYDIDCFMEAKSEYSAFKKLMTQLKKYNLHKDLESTLQYKDEFLELLHEYNSNYPYPDEQKNGYFGISSEASEGRNDYYIRYFFPIQ